MDARGNGDCMACFKASLAWPNALGCVGRMSEIAASPAGGDGSTSVYGDIRHPLARLWWCLSRCELYIGLSQSTIGYIMNL